MMVLKSQTFDFSRSFLSNDALDLMASRSEPRTCTLYVKNGSSLRVFKRSRRVGDVVAWRATKTS